MRIRDMFKARAPRRPQPLPADFSTHWSVRDWADLPPHHPRGDTPR